MRVRTLQCELAPGRLAMPDFTFQDVLACQPSLGGAYQGGFATCQCLGQCASAVICRPSPCAFVEK